MKEIKIESITMINFRGEKERTTRFNPDVTTISGGNGLGKTRHFVAFFWCLFGKDMLGRKNYEIRTRINGQILHKAECGVEVVMTVDGERITLKRNFNEKWVKSKGSAEAEYKGTETECWWNGTPVNVGEYDNRVAEIVDATIFKMITDPEYFVNMKWELQREQLFQMAGTLTDAEIAAGNADMEALLEQLNGKSLVDFKKEIAATKKKLNKSLAEVEPEIKQTQRLMPAPADFDAISEEIEKIDKERDEINRQMSDINARNTAANEAAAARQNKINQLKLQCQSALFRAQQAENARVHQANAESDNLGNEIKMKRQAVTSLRNLEKTQQSGITMAKRYIEQYAADIAKCEKERERLMAQWQEEDAKPFPGAGVCHVCGQPLPANMVAEAEKRFNDDKDHNCEVITEKGKRNNALKNEHIRHKQEQEKNLADLVRNLEQTQADIKKADDEILAMERRQSTLTTETPRQIKESDVEECRNIMAEIERVRSEETPVSGNTDTTALRTRLKELEAKRDTLADRMADKKRIEDYNAEIERLEANGRDYAAQISEWERKEFIMAKFSEKRIKECEARINGLFHNVRFQLFDKTIKGDVFEVCIPLVDGVPYGSANTAAQINAGLDIINALCRFYGITAPIFIDRREGVNEIIHTDAQIINLVVTKDKTLTIE